MIADLEWELVPEPTMKWKCLECRALFDGPRNRKPTAGCPECGSSVLIDINVVPVNLKLLPPQ